MNRKALALCLLSASLIIQPTHAAWYNATKTRAVCVIGATALTVTAVAAWLWHRFAHQPQPPTVIPAAAEGAAPIPQAATSEPFMHAYLVNQPNTTRYQLTVWQSNDRTALNGFSIMIDQSTGAITRTPLIMADVPEWMRDNLIHHALTGGHRDTVLLYLARMMIPYTKLVNEWHATQADQLFDSSPDAIAGYIARAPHA